MSGGRSRCSNCDSNRGLAEYPNGSYCFSCNRFNKSKSMIVSGPQVSKYSHKPNKEYIESLPCVYTTKCYDWLKQYHINYAHVKQYKIKGDEAHNRIIFPFYTTYIGEEPSEMPFCWIRNLGSTGPKWVFRGDSSKAPYMSHHMSEKSIQSSDIVVVEDVVSCIRAGQFMNCIALGGLNVKKLSWDCFSRYKNVYCWFDGDKAGQDAAIKFRDRFKLLCDVRIISTLKDPKCFTITNMREILCQN